MKKNNYRILLSAVLIAISATGYGQSKVTDPSSNQELAKLKAAVEANPNDLEAHKAYLAAVGSADDAKAQYEQWMKRFPGSAAIPQALGEKYGSYSPKAAQYLLQAATIDPKNADVWEKLSLDASIRGDRAKEIEYKEKAIAADPGDLKTQASYVYLFRENKDIFKQKAFEFVNKYPAQEESISILNLYGLWVKDNKEKIAAWEKLRSMFPTSMSVPFQVSMMRLRDVYIQTGQYQKAIELSEAYAGKAEKRLNFERYLQIAKTLADVDIKMKEGKYAEAKNIMMPLNLPSRNGFDVGTHVMLTKAKVLNASGATQAAYDSLILFQAKTPNPEVKDALEKYAASLGKNKTQVKQEVRAAISRNSRAALPFELDMYTSKEKVKLEDLKGKVVLLSFWYPACGPCRGEMPHIEKAIKNVKKKMVYYGVNGVRSQDDFVLPFMNGTGYSFTPLGANEQILKDYNVRAYPSNLIIDQDGRIAYANFLIEDVNEQMLEMMIESLL